MIAARAHHDERALDPSARQKLHTSGAASRGRLLPAARKRLDVRGRSWTKPGP